MPIVSLQENEALRSVEVVRKWSMGLSCAIAGLILFDLIIAPLPYRSTWWISELTRADHAPLWIMRSVLLVFCAMPPAMAVILRKQIDLADFCAYSMLCLTVYNVFDYASLIPVVCWTIFLVAAHLDSKQTGVLTAVLMIVFTWHITTTIGIYLFSSHDFVTPGFGRRAGGVYGDPNFVYPLSIMGAFYINAIAVVLPHRFYRISKFAVAAGMLATILTFTRGAWLAIAAALLCDSRRGYRAKGIWLPVVLILGSIFVRTGGSLIGNQNDRSTVGRLMVWADAMEVVRLNPWSGAGYDGYMRSAHSNVPSSFLMKHKLPIEPKNVYLCLADDYGIPGLILTVAWSISVFGGCRRAYQAAPVRAALLSSIAFAVAGIVDTPAFGPVGREGATLCYMTIMGVACSCSRNFATSYQFERGNAQADIGSDAKPIQEEISTES